MKLTTIRDLAVTVGAAVITAAAAFLTADDLNLIKRANNPLEEKRKRDERAGRATFPGDHGDLYRVDADYGGAERSTYVRPALEDEAKMSRAAEDTFGLGTGVFAVTADERFVLPGDTEWLQATAPQGPALTYYRVS